MIRTPAAGLTTALALLLVAFAIPAGHADSPEPAETQAESHAATQVRSRTAGESGSHPLTLTTSGPVRGVRDGKVDRYRGIPYAAPPVGDLRWKAPRPPESWWLPRDASESGNPCPQLAEGKQLPGSSEDCLFLEVTTPRTPADSSDPGQSPSDTGNPGTSSDTGKPVMVWLHGGGNVTGSGPEFDPARMATAGDVVVVTLNYRLGALGFFGYDGLDGSGSFGLLDQQAALRWVRQNAAFFGGDPTNVTLFGESAGGVDTCAQLTSPAARGLFDKAILQSGGCHTRIPTYVVGQDVTISHDDFWTPVDQLRATGREVAEELGCAPDEAGGDVGGDVGGNVRDRREVLSCLRELPPRKLLAYGTSFGVAEGTRTLPEHPGTAVSEGRIHRVPVLSGYTRDEMRYTTMLVEASTGPITEQRYQDLLRQAFGEQAETVRSAYPVEAYDSPNLAFAAMDTDRAFACPQLSTNRELAGVVPTYGYEFADRTAPTYAPFFTDIPPGASHASELAYLFDLAIGPWGPDFKQVELTERQHRLAEEMIRAWTRFAHTGSPDSADDWPEFGNGEQQSVHEFAPVTGTSGDGTSATGTSGDGGSGLIDAAERHNCDLWSGLADS